MTSVYSLDGEKHPCTYWKRSKDMDNCLEDIISRTFEEVKNAICNDYCRYPREWNEEEQGMDLIDSDICANCPLNRL